MRGTQTPIIPARSVGSMQSPVSHVENAPAPSSCGDRSPRAPPPASFGVSRSRPCRPLSSRGLVSVSPVSRLEQGTRPFPLPAGNARTYRTPAYAAPRGLIHRPPLLIETKSGAHPFPQCAPPHISGIFQSSSFSSSPVKSNSPIAASPPSFPLPRGLSLAQ